MKNKNQFLLAGLCLVFFACQKLDKGLVPTPLLEPSTAVNNSTARIGKGGCMLNAQDDGSIFAFNYNSDGSPASAVIDGYLVHYDEIKDGLITKLSYGEADAPRTISVQYNNHGRPIKAQKTLSTPGFQYIANFTLTYNTQGRLATMLADYDGDFEFTLAHRLVYSPKGNVTAHYIAENGDPEYIWAKLSQFDVRKNAYEEVAFHPINLFYDPAGMGRYLSANNVGRVDLKAENSNYFGTLIGWDEYKYLAYSPQGYPIQIQNNYDYNYVDFDAHIVDTWTYNYSYLCENGPCKHGKGGGKRHDKSPKRKLN